VTLDRLGFLLGTWRGSGVGTYPTITGFDYDEEVVFGAIPGKPFVTYTQRTRSPEGAPLHAEAGFFRSPTVGVAEVVIAQPTGIVEVLAGTLDGSVLEVSSSVVAGTPTAVEVTAVTRRVEVDGDTLRYRLGMAAVGQPLQVHLEAELTRRRP
jgi:hypothetical protein